MELLINWHQTSLLFLFTICPQKYILLCNGHSIIHDQVATDALASNYTFLLELQSFSVTFFAQIKFWRTLFTESDMDSLAITSFVLWSDKGPKPMAGFKQNLFSVEVLTLESGWRQNDQWASRWNLKAFANFLKTNLLFWLALLKTKLYVLIIFKLLSFFLKRTTTLKKSLYFYEASTVEPPIITNCGKKDKMSETADSYYRSRTGHNIVSLKE